MFGYVRPLKGELLVREYEEYKAVYCTLCKALGRYYGIRMRFALSYDICLYTMLALDITEAKPSVKKGTCPFNPLKKCNFICEDEIAYKKGAALTVLMTYHKILDNIEDESFIKKTGAKILKAFVKKPAEKAARDYPFMADAIEKMTEMQALAEKEEEPFMDLCCEPTAKALSDIFKELGKTDSEGLVLSQLGYFLGRWIYAMDAADDLKDDLLESSFNPFIYKFKLDGLKELPKEQEEEIDLECNAVLNSNVAMINGAVTLLPEGKYKPIIENIMGKGLAETQREILFLHIKEKKKRELD